jgi:hypothetical protein
LESRKPLFSPHLGLKRGEVPLLLALQPALDALPSRERQALLAWGVLGEVPEEALTGLVGAFSRERLFREGLLEGNRPLEEVGEAALRLVPAETQRAWHLEAARLLRAQLLLEAGEKVEHLLGFTPSLPLTRAWKAALLGEEPEGLQGYGMLGRWVRRLWRSRGITWIRSRW